VASIAQLQADLASLQSEAEATAELLVQVRDDLGTLQEAGDADTATLDRLSAGVATVTAGQSMLQESLDSLSSVQAALDQTLDTVRSETDELAQTVDDLSDGLAALDDELHGDGALASLRSEVALLRAMGSLTRARLLLVQSNYGLARSEIETARVFLAALRPEAADSGQAEALGQALARLDAAAANLPTAPVAAADELEGAWQLLVASLPETASATEGAATIDETPEATAQPTAAPEGTPEATAVPEATPTAAVTLTPAPTATP
jgi:chromosome segregation ATPase